MQTAAGAPPPAHHAPAGYDLPAPARVVVFGCDRLVLRRFDAAPVLVRREALAGVAWEPLARVAARFVVARLSRLADGARFVVAPFEPAVVRFAVVRLDFAVVRFAGAELRFGAARFAAVPLGFAVAFFAVA